MDARGAYNLSEIWPGFRTSNNIDSNAAGSAALYSAISNPMPTDQTSNHGRPNHKSRKRSGHHGLARAVASTGNSNGSGGSNDNNEGDSKRMKMDTPNENIVDEEGGEGNTKNEAEVPKQDYIHVRARRGQATDSHSLAERARREKISERMKILQDIVPGCNKVIGKALVLDEIINYIQSLQRQVDFLSVKLEAVNTRPDIDGYSLPKDKTTRELYDIRDSSPEWLHMQVGGGSFERPS